MAAVSKRGVVLAGAGVVVLAGLALLLGGPGRSAPADYVGSQACGSCHTVNHPNWQRTLHASMVREATPATVLGDFERKNVYWLHDDVRTASRPKGDRPLVRMVRSGDEYYAYVYDPQSDEMNPYKITHVVGTTYRQTYLIHSRGVFFRVPIQWAIHQQRWINLWNRQDMKKETVDGPMNALLNVNGRWNEFCARCHTTGYREGGGGSWNELGIACEACHGPGSRHVEAYEASKPRRLRSEILKVFGVEPDNFIVRPSRLSPERSVSVCGQCHQADTWMATVSRFVEYEPGEDLSPHFGEIPLEKAQARPPSNKTWPDGSPRGPGVLFRSFVESRCFAEGGLTCIDCHDPHRGGVYDGLLEAGAESDRLCVRCHAETGRAGEAHTHHPAGTPGSFCYDCHLPRMLEGLVLVGEFDYNRVRTHEVDHIPYPEASIGLGGLEAMPNACSACHQGHDARWAAEWSVRWWGDRARIADEIAARPLATAASDAATKTSGL